MWKRGVRKLSKIFRTEVNDDKVWKERNRVKEMEEVETGRKRERENQREKKESKKKKERLKWSVCIWKKENEIEWEWNPWEPFLMLSFLSLSP